jgi:hypothetical protein
MGETQQPKYLLLTSDEIEQKVEEFKEEFGSENLFFKRNFNNKFLGGTEVVSVMLRDSSILDQYNIIYNLVCIDYNKINIKQLKQKENLARVQIQIPLKLGKEYKEFEKEDLEGENLQKSIRRRKKTKRNKNEKVV